MTKKHNKHFQSHVKTMNYVLGPYGEKAVNNSSKARKNLAKKARQAKKKKLLEQARKMVQLQFTTQPKQVHNKVFGRVAGNAKLTAVLDNKTGHILNHPEQVVKQVHTHSQDQARPAFGPKTGKYLPKDISRKYPWEIGGHSNLDPFRLETKVGQLQYGKVSVLDHVKCPSLFSERIRRLSNNKQPGPDGI